MEEKYRLLKMKLGKLEKKKVGSIPYAFQEKKSKKKKKLKVYK